MHSTPWLGCRMLMLFWFCICMHESACALRSRPCCRQQFESNEALALYKDQDAGLSSGSAFVNYHAPTQPASHNAHIAMPLGGSYFLPGLSDSLQVRERLIRSRGVVQIMKIYTALYSDSEVTFLFHPEVISAKRCSCIW